MHASALLSWSCVIMAAAFCLFRRHQYSPASRQPGGTTRSGGRVTSGWCAADLAALAGGHGRLMWPAALSYSLVPLAAAWPVV